MTETQNSAQLAQEPGNYRHAPGIANERMARIKMVRRPAPLFWPTAQCVPHGKPQHVLLFLDAGELKDVVLVDKQIFGSIDRVESGRNRLPICSDRLGCRIARQQACAPGDQAVWRW